MSDDKPKRTVDPIDFTKPVAIILFQTDTRNNVQVITPADCEGGETPVERAEKMAAGMALNNDRTVAVFGPQLKVKIPPKEPQADDLDLSFDEPATAEE